MGGRTRGQQNIVSRDVRAAIVAGLEAAGGGNMADLVTRIALEDRRLAVAMMALVCPRAVDAVVRHEPVLVTIEQLDESLRQAGLPITAEAFRLDYRGPDPIEDVSEAEILEAEEAAKK